jgi:hypothetical protein
MIVRVKRCAESVRVLVVALTAALVLSFLLVARPSYADADSPITWSDLDIGGVDRQGSSSIITASSFTVAAGAGGLTQQADAFHFVYRYETGDFYITAHVRFAGTHTPGTAGIMVREELASVCHYVGIFLSPDGKCSEGFRNDYASVSPGDYQKLPSDPTWLRMVKQGATLQAYGGDDSPGRWVLVGRSLPTATGMVFAGLSVSSGSIGDPMTAMFDHVSLVDGTLPIDNGDYYIHPVSNSGLFLDGNDGVDQPVTLALGDQSVGQVWTLTAKGPGAYALINKKDPSMALTVSEGNWRPGTKVVLHSDHGLDTQLWSIVPAGPNAFNVFSKRNLGTGLDDYGGSAVPGPSVDIWSNIDGDPHQEWILAPAS